MRGIGSTTGTGRVLDFDIENRPLSYWQPDEPTAEITAIGMMWVGQPDSLEVVLLGRETPVQMLKRFLEFYNQADLVTGHYIRKHDLPIINAALMEYGLPLLSPKMTSDTRLDLVRKSGLPATQEFLLEILDIDSSKLHMTQMDWREANRLTRKGLKKSYDRVSSDVVGHAALRAEMLKRGLLGPPRMWSGSK